MSECGVCIGGGDPDCYAEFQDVTTPKARKEHKCCECGRTIVIGEKYERWSAKWDGDMCCEKTCLQCAEIRNAFNCGNSYTFGLLWEEMQGYAFEHINTACFERLSTPEAKKFLREKWMQWKGLAA